MEKKIKIVLTGPESTGKSKLCCFLANNYQTICSPEYAREYIEALNRDYTFEDVEIIAKKQIELEELMLQRANKILFVDTSLIITKVWFDVVFNRTPKWLHQKIDNNLADFFLLCNTDVQWKEDSVRENGGKMRDVLFEKYKNELEYLGVDYKIISGIGKTREKNALESVEKYLIKMKKTQN